MSDETAPVTSFAPVNQAPAQTVPLGEFVQSLSARDRRVELVNAFHASEVAAGRNHDTEAAFQNRFVQFANLPA